VTAFTIDRQCCWDRNVTFTRWQHPAMGRRARFAVRGTTASHSGQSCQNDVFDQLFIDDVHTEGGRRWHSVKSGHGQGGLRAIMTYTIKFKHNFH